MAIALAVRRGLGLALLRGRHNHRHQEYDKRRCCMQALASAGSHTDGEVRFPPRDAPLFNCSTNDQWVLSLAHSGPWLLASAACVIGRRTCMGVDVEQRKPRDFDGIGRFLGWPSRSRDDLHFYRRWTLAEALFKATAQDARRWFDLLDRSAGNAAASAGCVDAHGWRWCAWWPQLASGACICLVVGIEQ